MVSDLLGLGSQIVGVNTYAMSTNQTWRVFVEKTGMMPSQNICRIRKIEPGEYSNANTSWIFIQ